MLTFLVFFKSHFCTVANISLLDVSRNARKLPKDATTKGLVPMPYLGHQVYIYHNFLTLYMH